MATILTIHNDTYHITHGKYAFYACRTHCGMHAAVPEPELLWRSPLTIIVWKSLFNCNVKSWDGAVRARSPWFFARLGQDFTQVFSVLETHRAVRATSDSQSNGRGENISFNQFSLILERQSIKGVHKLPTKTRFVNCQNKTDTFTQTKSRRRAASVCPL